MSPRPSTRNLSFSPSSSQTNTLTNSFSHSNSTIQNSETSPLLGNNSKRSSSYFPFFNPCCSNSKVNVEDDIPDDDDAQTGSASSATVAGGKVGEGNTSSSVSRIKLTADHSQCARLGLSTIHILNHSNPFFEGASNFFMLCVSILSLFSTQLSDAEFWPIIAGTLLCGILYFNLERIFIVHKADENLGHAAEDDGLPLPSTASSSALQRWGMGAHSIALVGGALSLSAQNLFTLHNTLTTMPSSIAWGISTFFAFSTLVRTLKIDVSFSLGELTKQTQGPAWFKKLNQFFCSRILLTQASLDPFASGLFHAIATGKGISSLTTINTVQYVGWALACLGGYETFRLRGIRNVGEAISHDLKTKSKDANSDQDPGPVVKTIGQILSTIFGILNHTMRTAGLVPDTLTRALSRAIGGRNQYPERLTTAILFTMTYAFIGQQVWEEGSRLLANSLKNFPESLQEYTHVLETFLTDDNIIDTTVMPIVLATLGTAAAIAFLHSADWTPYYKSPTTNASYNAYMIRTNPNIAIGGTPLSVKKLVKQRTQWLTSLDNFKKATRPLSEQVKKILERHSITPFENIETVLNEFGTYLDEDRNVANI